MFEHRTIGEGTIVRILNDEGRLSAAGLEVLLEDHDIFDTDFQVDDVVGGWYTLAGDRFDVHGLTFPEELLIVQ